MISPTPTEEFHLQLREAYESRYKSIRRLVLAIQKVYGEDSISMRTVKRLLTPGYRPRNRRPYYQLKHVLPKLQIPEAS